MSKKAKTSRKHRENDNDDDDFVNNIIAHMK